MQARRDFSELVPQSYSWLLLSNALQSSLFLQAVLYLRFCLSYGI